MLQKESSFIDIHDVRNWNTSHAKRGGMHPIIFTQGHVPWQAIIEAVSASVQEVSLPNVPANLRTGRLFKIE